MDKFHEFQIHTAQGMIPLQYLLSVFRLPLKQAPFKGLEARRVITLQADVTEGKQVTSQLKALQTAMKNVPSSCRCTHQGEGEQEDQQETVQFLITAFLLALFGMLLILVVQFNSYYQAALVLSAIVFSTAGVLFGATDHRPTLWYRNGRIGHHRFWPVLW